MNVLVEPSRARSIYLLLRDRIGSGALQDGDRLPGEPDLAAEYGVSRMTVRRALDQLAASGMVERRPGVGTFVTLSVPAPGPIDVSDVFSDLKQMGRRTEVRLLDFGYGIPAPAIAAALALPPGSRAQRAVRVRSVAGEPFSFLTTHVPEQIGSTYSEADLASRPLLELLERCGRRLGDAKQSIAASLAGPMVAAALQVDMGAPLIALTRLVEDADGQPIEHLHALYRPDRFTFEMRLQRTGTEGARRWSPLPLATQQEPA
ncbi:GntR family transcriptional regulator [Teichococcus vastitatis]|uniref:GntR family transcriptional regulator n=1 Tax=Teichococcus vastitatis TaxID=2307076 RepID=UPI000E758618|nr:GntR family transcriptional regulator [Pseudoroseomonas vastitatis]